MNEWPGEETAEVEREEKRRDEKRRTHLSSSYLFFAPRFIFTSSPARMCPTCLYIYPFFPLSLHRMTYRRNLFLLCPLPPLSLFLCAPETRILTSKRGSKDDPCFIKEERRQRVKRPRDNFEKIRRRNGVYRRRSLHDNYMIVRKSRLFHA